MKARGSLQGVLTIVRFNGPFYIFAGLVIIASATGVMVIEIMAVRWLCLAALVSSLHLTFASLAVSWWVYDRSDLYRWKWLGRALGDSETNRIIVCHSGFDEVSTALAGYFPAAEHIVLDHYDPVLMTEPSIRRARREFPPAAGTIAADFSRWQADSGIADVVFGLLAIHELRTESQRIAWFCEAARCLKPNGRIVLAEHVRDAANLLAFGPGFLHFHSPRSWRNSWQRAGLRLADGFRVTPWVRIFVIVKP
jgi:hypothetical protein